MPRKKKSNCSTGCPTQDHANWGECMRSKHLNLNPNLANTQKTISTERELQAYRDARRQGVRPDGTTMAKVEQAMKISEETGKPYGA
jgi:hypothetical protein